MVKCPEKYPFSNHHINVKIQKDNLVDKEENPVFLSLGNTMEERAKAYKEFVSDILEEDKLKLIRKTLNGQSHFTSDRFLA